MDPHQPAPPAPAPLPPPAAGGSVRLVILIGVLLVVVGALGYDIVVLKPACDKAYADIQKLVDERNKQGVKTGSLVTSADIQKLLGRKPTWTVEDEKLGYTLEYYCWWGKMPLLNRRRHFIAVMYVGQKPRHFSSHYQEEPPKEAYPLPPGDGEDEGQTFPLPETTTAGKTGDGKAGEGKTGEGKTGDKAGSDKATDKPAEPPASEKSAGEKPADEKSKTEEPKP